jgi:hypothetical protein
MRHRPSNSNGRFARGCLCATHSGRGPLHAHEVFDTAPPSPPSVSASSSAATVDEGHPMDAEEGATPTLMSAPHGPGPVRKSSHHAPMPMSLCDSISEGDDEGDFGWRRSDADHDFHSPKQQQQQPSFVAVAEMINEAAGPEDEDFEFV